MRYTIGDSISLWVNPTLTGSEPTPTIKVGIDPSVSSVSDFGHLSYKMALNQFVIWVVFALQHQYGHQSQPRSH